MHPTHSPQGSTDSNAPPPIYFSLHEQSRTDDLSRCQCNATNCKEQTLSDRIGNSNKAPAGVIDWVNGHGCELRGFCLSTITKPTLISFPISNPGTNPARNKVHTRYKPVILKTITWTNTGNRTAVPMPFLKTTAALPLHLTDPGELRGGH